MRGDREMEGRMKGGREVWMMEERKKEKGEETDGEVERGKNGNKRE